MTAAMKRTPLPTLDEHAAEADPFVLRAYGISLCLVACFVLSVPVEVKGWYEWAATGAVHVRVNASAAIAVLLVAEGAAWVACSVGLPWPENRADPLKAALASANGAALSLLVSLQLGEHSAVRLFQDAALAAVAPVVLFEFEQTLFQSPRIRRALFACYIGIRAASVLPAVALGLSYHQEPAWPVAGMAALALAADWAAWRFAVSPTFSYARLWAFTSACLLASKLLFLRM